MPTIEHLKLADGTCISTKTGDVVVVRKQYLDEAEVKDFDPDDPVVGEVRRLDDLPGAPKQMSAILAIIGYTVCGVPIHDIAKATGIDYKDVQELQLTDEYAQTHAMMLKGLLDYDSNNVNTMIARKARVAANELITQLEESKSPAMRAKIAQDVLDRSGHRPADIIQHNHHVSGGLIIEHVKKDPNKTIDVSFKELK